LLNIVCFAIANPVTKRLKFFWMSKHRSIRVIT
jgi:hypothetical protein